VIKSVPTASPQAQTGDSGLLRPSLHGKGHSLFHCGAENSRLSRRGVQELLVVQVQTT
jgi:hypothetical protein